MQSRKDFCWKETKKLLFIILLNEFYLYISYAILRIFSVMRVYVSLVTSILDKMLIFFYLY